jgi:lysophospholipid acyltransferase (LPLAT)-like uncharacterized protein
MRTLRYQYRPLGSNFDPHQTAPGERYIYAFWHENLLLPAYCYSRSDVYVLISRHADGQLIAEVCRHLGFRTVRGSTNRNGVEAVRQLLRFGKVGHLGITPDGPRGPRRRVQPGLIYLAARTGLPIIPAGFGYEHPWRMRSWDAFAVPRPGRRATCVTTRAFRIPADAGREELEHHRRLVEDALLQNTEVAQRWAEGGEWPLDSFQDQLRMTG